MTSVASIARSCDHVILFKLSRRRRMDGLAWRAIGTVRAEMGAVLMVGPTSQPQGSKG